MDDTSSDRRGQVDRRGYWRGGRRRADWPETVVTAPTCPRCDSPEVKFVEATPAILFWQCHRCGKDWESAPDGR